MKKVTRIFGMACMVGLLAFGTSCKKNDETKGSSVSVNVPQMSVVNVDGDRAYIDENYQFNWMEEDYIKVYNLNTTDYDASVSSIFHNVSGAGPRATFKGPSIGATQDCIFYFYPVNMVSDDEVYEMELLANENREEFIVSDTQSFEYYEGPDHPIFFTDPDAMPMAINTPDLTENATLKHIFGVASIILKAQSNLPEPLKVRRVTITDNVFNLSGKAQVRLHAVNMQTLKDLMAYYKAGNDAQFAALYESFVMDPVNGMGWSATETGKTMTLDCGEEGQVIMGGNNRTYFNFMLRPLALSQGFTVTVEYMDGTTNVIDRWVNPNRAMAMEPGVIKSFTYPYGLPMAMPE